MKVYVPSPLRMYTGKAGVVDADGTTLAELFADLERRYAGIRFRIVNEQDRVREHIKIFVNKEIADGMSYPLQSSDTVRISMALSGGHGA